MREDGAREVVALGRDGRRRRRRWGLFGILAVVAALLTEGCCADEPQWFLVLHCEDGIHLVECYREATCKTLADAVLAINTQCNSATLGTEEACQDG